MERDVCVAERGVGLKRLDADGPHAQKLMRCDGEYELWRLSTQKQLFEAIGYHGPNDEQLPVPNFHTLVTP